MIDIDLAIEVFKAYIKPFDNEEEAGFELKEKHTYNVMKRSRVIAEALNLDDEDVRLAELIGLLHDIGRFEEMTVMKSFDSGKFDHAAYGVKILFEDGLISKITEEKDLYPIIKAAIFNHNKLTIEDGLNERALLHAKIIRDSDKIDNFEIKINRNPEHLFKNVVNSRDEFENSDISEKIYKCILDNQCIILSDRKLPLDYYVTIWGFVYDIYFKESYETIKQNDYINRMIDRFEYKVPGVQDKIECMRSVLNKWIDSKI